MKLTRHPFKSDVIEFTWADLLKIAFGFEVKDGALIAKLKEKNS